MTTDIPQVPENEYDELICIQCLKVIGWAKSSCEKSAERLLGSMCPECYLRKLANKTKHSIPKKRVAYRNKDRDGRFLSFRSSNLE